MSPEALMEDIASVSVSPYKEAVAYEYLYSIEGMTLKKIADMTIGQGKLPSEALRDCVGLIEPPNYSTVSDYIDSKVGIGFSVAVKGTPSWPAGIADSARPSPVIYFSGDVTLLDTPRVSIVGSRKASEEGRSRAAKLGHQLAEAGITIVSGLAAGIDTAAMSSAVNTTCGDGRGRTIGVIGTPIDVCYPKQNVELQRYVAAKDLLISQVPFYRYSVQPFKTRRYYFPERNELMAAVSLATVIVEASDTSGTLTQARACQHQHRPLFIMRSCFDNPNVEWPKKWAKRENVFILDDASQVIDAVAR